MAANFLHSADLGSDSDDEDYIPDDKDNEGLSEEEEGSGNDEDLLGEDARKGGKKNKKSKKVKGKPALPARGALFQDDVDADNRSKEFEKEKEEKLEEGEKKKVDDLWADFKKDVGSKSKPKPVGSGLGSLANMCAPISSSLSKATHSMQSQPPRSIISSIFDQIPAASASRKEKLPVPSGDDEEKKIKITQVFDFAGESVSITKEVDKDSKEGKKFVLGQDKEQPQAHKRPGGLSSIMNVIAGKKKKMGCLDKSKLDWDSFVQQEGIKEDLEIHNKGKEGYVEKQAFLERADLRRFELEKEARDQTRKTFKK